MICSSARSLRTPRTICRGSSWPTVFSDSDDDCDTTRAEFIRAQCASAHAEALALFRAHAWRWAGLDEPPHNWSVGASLALATFERGFVTHLRVAAGDAWCLAPLRRLLVCEPVQSVQFHAQNALPERAADVRTLLPFSHSITVTVTRAGRRNEGAQDAFIAAILSAPVLSSATELVLGDLHPGRTGAPLVCWLAESPFLGNVRSLKLSRNGFTNAEACALAKNPRLPRVRHLDVTANNIGEPGCDALEARFGNGLVI